MVETALEHVFRISSRLALLSLLLVPFATPAAAGDVEITVPSNEEIEDVFPEGQISAKEIYERYLKNRLHSAVQYQTVTSTDASGSTQTSRFWVRWKDFRDEHNRPTDGVIAKTIVKFQDPFDIRHTGYLVIVNDDLSRDEFLYQPSTRKVRRVSMRGSSVGASDFSFDDLGFNDVDDATYTRFEDETIGGVEVYVIEAKKKPEVVSRYYKTLAYLEKEHYVPLKARYWDTAGVEVRELDADPQSLKEFHGVWVATKSKMRNLQQDTSSELTIEDLDPNTEIAEAMFSTFRLQVDR
jgi:hypothetical protein